MKSELFLLGLRLSGRAVVVVGSGEEAERRARALVEAGARVTVISEHPTDALAAEAARGAWALAVRPFVETDLDGTWLAVSTDLDPVLAGRVSRAADARCVFHCAVDLPELGSFSHVALAREGDVTLAVSTNGRAPALARRLREELERLLRGSRIAAFIDDIALVRDRTPSTERRAVLGAAVAKVRFTGALELPDGNERVD